jgi:hypothetical protein
MAAQRYSTANHPIIRFKCEWCGESFRRRSDCDGHYFKHAGVRPYICGSCTETFYTRRQLRIHEGKQCYCPKGCAGVFCAVEGLQAHLKEQYCCPQQGSAGVFCADEGLQAHHEYVCHRTACSDAFCTDEGLQAHLEKQYACHQESCANVFCTGEALQAHLKYTCHGGCANGFCTSEALQAHLKYTCPWGCANGFCTSEALQAHLKYTCPWGCANGFCASEGLQAYLVAEHGKSPVTTTLRSHLAEYMKRDRDTRREAEMKRENEMKKEAQVKTEVQIMRVHIMRKYDARTKRGHNAINLVNDWKTEIRTRNRSTSSAEKSPGLNPKEDCSAEQHIIHPLDSNASNPTQDCTEQDSRTHPTGLATLHTDPSVLHNSTVNRLSQAGQQISRKGKVSSTDSGDIENCSSPIGEPAPRARTRQALRKLNLGQQPKNMGELFRLTSLL